MRDTTRRDSVFVLFLLLVTAGVTFLIGWQTGQASVPDPVSTHEIERVQVTPPECLRALAIADKELSLAAQLSLVMSQVAPLVDDAYQAGLDGNTSPKVIEKVKRVNDRYTELWQELGTLPNTRAKIADACRDASP